MLHGFCALAAAAAPAVSGSTCTAHHAAAAAASATAGTACPLQDRTSCNFSFSGLKTSIGKLVETEKARLADEGADEAAVGRCAARLHATCRMAWLPHTLGVLSEA